MCYPAQEKWNSKFESNYYKPAFVHPVPPLNHIPTQYLVLFYSDISVQTSQLHSTLLIDL